jgi:protease IV
MRLTRIPLGSIAIAAIAMVSALYGTLRTDGAASANEVAKGTEVTKASDSTKPIVAVIRLRGNLLETPQDETLSFSAEKTTSLNEVIERFQKARDDKHVKAVVLTVDELKLGGWAQIEELRQAIEQLRGSGKEVYAHADSLSLPHYLLLAGATQISVVPTGDIWLTGLHGESPYARGLLNKIGVMPDILTCGAYKSAAEIFMREGPSPQAEEMMNWLLDSLYDSAIKSIAQGRGVEPDRVKAWINDGPYTARRAHEVGLIDAVQYREDFEAGVKQRFDGDISFDYKYGQNARTKFDFSSPMGIFNFYAELLGGKKVKSHKDAVAIVYVEGPIVLGSTESSILDPGSKVAASTPIRRALDKVAVDDSIKAVVLRVNSPGGSATASEIILNATKRVKLKKPFVVSMGNVAGSGGYYVACGADTIFADATTVTGSIGVLGGKLVTTEMWNKIGINWKEYNRGDHAALLASSGIFTPEQRKIVQSWMDEIYGVFKSHVIEIRGSRLKKPLDDIAGGRVYMGRQALELGLVDKMGTLDDAVKFVADEAKLEKYERRVMPEPKNLLEKLLEGTSAGDQDEDEVGLPANLLITGSSQPDLLAEALPYLRNLDPRKVDAVLQAFRQLETLDQEGVVLMTPEIVFGWSARGFGIEGYGHQPAP